MASTVTQLITKFTQAGFYPDCDATISESLFNDVYKEILLSLQLRTNTVNISLTADTATYDLDENIIRVHEAWYDTDATPVNSKCLEQVSLDALRLLYPHESTQSAGTPRMIYSTSAVSSDSGKQQVGLIPPPDTSTAGTYPRLRLVVTQYATLTASETLPNSVLTDDLFLYGMAKKWAIRQDAERVAYWTQLYAMEMGVNADRINRTLVQAPLGQTFTPFAGNQSRLR